MNAITVTIEPEQGTLLTVRQAAMAYNRTENWLRKMLRHGFLKAHYLEGDNDHRVRYIDMRELEALLHNPPPEVITRGRNVSNMPYMYRKIYSVIRCVHRDPDITPEMKENALAVLRFLLAKYAGGNDDTGEYET